MKKITTIALVLTLLLSANITGVFANENTQMDVNETKEEVQMTFDSEEERDEYIQNIMKNSTINTVTMTQAELDKKIEDKVRNIKVDDNKYFINGIDVNDKEEISNLSSSARTIFYSYVDNGIFDEIHTPEGNVYVLSEKADEYKTLADRLNEFTNEVKSFSFISTDEIAKKETSHISFALGVVAGLLLAVPLFKRYKIHLLNSIEKQNDMYSKVTSLEKKIKALYVKRDELDGEQLEEINKEIEVLEDELMRVMNIKKTDTKEDDDND